VWLKETLREPRRVQRRPEAIPRPREVVTHGGRVQPRVDAAEEHIQIRRQYVTKALPVGGLDLLHCGLFRSHVGHLLPRVQWRSGGGLCEENHEPIRIRHIEPT
jgi:hypothetical protein